MDIANLIFCLIVFNSHQYTGKKNVLNVYFVHVLKTYLNKAHFVFFHSVDANSVVAIFKDAAALMGFAFGVTLAKHRFQAFSFLAVKPQWTA